MRENIKKQARSSFNKKGKGGVWLSKEWLDNWKTDECDDESNDINQLIMCEHENLSPSAPKVCISPDVWNSLSQIFTFATAFENDVEPCTICQSEITKRKQEHELTKSERDKEKVNKKNNKIK